MEFKEMEFKGTKGDWFYNGDIYPVIESKTTNVETKPTIASVNSTFRTQEETIANAKLIAASPDLLAALINLRKNWLDGKAYIQAEKAIEKALM